MPDTQPLPGGNKPEALIAPGSTVKSAGVAVPVQPTAPAPSVKPVATLTSTVPASTSVPAPMASAVAKPASAPGAPAAPSAYSLPTQPAKPTGNVFTQLFGKSGQGGLGAQPMKPMASVTASPSIASLLGPKPTVTRESLIAAEEHRRSIAKTLFTIAVVAAAGTYGFFYSQLEPDFTWFADQFGPNVGQRFERSNSELQKVKTDANLVNYRLARLWLDEANSKIDSYMAQAAIKKSDFTTNAQKTLAGVEMKKTGDGIKKSLVEAKKILSQPIGINTFSREPVTDEQREQSYETSLKEKLTEQRSALSADGAADPQDIRAFDNILRLVDNKSFRNLLVSADLEKITDDGFYSLLGKIREEGTDELSQVEKIKKNRINWAEIIQDVHAVTRKVDPLYGQGLFKTIGGFLFVSYRFDSKTGKVNVSGMTKTSDSKTFSFVAKLVEAIEKSPKFKDIDFRSFSKSKDESGDFSSTLALDFATQTGIDPRDDVPGSEAPPTSAPAAKQPE